ncbi:YopX family protein [Bacillus cereus]|uniref:YopX family protein n=1 Tax=Bacillus cereus TaxID=1396 RepID=UPI00027AB6ED|nr:YopX family protein [Bacillus cereus]EJS63436.1 hypothetical protein ICY_05273 [Bacillus cereus BAG2X1-3]
MREIKFRAWVLQDEVDGEYIAAEYMEDNVESFHDPLYEHKQGNVVLMQYTGLKDKNGKEIYEGDILKEKDIVTKVVFHDFRWQEKLISSPRNHLKNYFPFRDTLPFTAVVIGNIYENPELVKN